MAKVPYEIKKLRRECWGLYDEICKRSGYSKTTISQVLNGVYINVDVIRVAKEVVAENKEKQQTELEAILK